MSSKSFFDSLTLVLIGSLALFSFAGLFAQSSELPNVIIVITDDQGKNDLGCEGNPIIKTPHLDQFHAESVRLTNFHVSTTCTPSRASLMTGRHTNRLNAYHTIAGRSILLPDEVILPQILAQQGYTTGMFGKWHLGDNYPYRPEDRGFQEVVRHGGGGVGQGPDYWGNDYFDDTYWKNGVPTPYQGYCTDVFFDEALAFIASHRHQPFFCYISTNAPHGPFNVPEAYLDLYADRDDLTENQQRFYGMITNIDDNFARLRQTLSDLDLEQNTILIFMTDNGTALGHQVYDAGMTGNKGSVFEGGHNVPCYMRWPSGSLEGGRDINELTAHYDLVPTIVDLLKIPHHSVKPLDGLSLKPLLHSQSVEWPNRILYMDTQRGINLVKYKNYTVMDQDWRLVDGDQLYRMSTDLKQEHNVIEQHPEIASRLAGGYEQWWQSFLDEGADQHYAYLQVGTPHENPVTLMSHDMISAMHSSRWHQYGAITAAKGLGVYKVEVMANGTYEIAVRRFPREASLGINSEFPAGQAERRLARAAPASIKSDFTNCRVALGKFQERKDIKGNPLEVLFTCELATGKYDFEAYLEDSAGNVYPAYYVSIRRTDG